MKKLLLSLASGLLVSVSALAGGYRLNETNLENAFANAEDITFSVVDQQVLAVATPDTEITKTGFLIRAFFCGNIGLHRIYAGTGGATLWWKYLCIPCVGGLTGAIDFWGTIIKGDEFFEKYKDNPKFMVWKK